MRYRLAVLVCGVVFAGGCARGSDSGGHLAGAAAGQAGSVGASPGLGGEGSAAAGAGGVAGSSIGGAAEGGGAGAAQTGGAAGSGAAGGPQGVRELVHYFGRWNIEPTQATTVNTGSYVLATFAGTGLSAAFDLTNNTGEIPSVAWQIDAGAFQEAVVAPTLALAKNLSAGMHSVRLVVRATSEFQNRWAAPRLSSVSFVHFLVSGGAVVLSPRPLGSKIEFLGDSITEGYKVLLPTSAHETDAWLSDGRRNYAHQTGVALNADFRQVGFGGQGITHGGGGGVPSSGATFPLIYDGAPRDDWQPDVVIVNQATNDMNVSSAAFSPRYADYLAQIRAGYPDAQILALRPFGGFHGRDIAAIVAARSATDERVAFVDTSGWLMPPHYTDGVHPNLEGSNKARQRLVAEIAPYLLPAGSCRVFRDADADGYGSAQVANPCQPTPGYVSRNGDCDDADPLVFPGGLEFCDGADNDCDAGSIEECPSGCMPGPGTSRSLACVSAASVSAAHAICEHEHMVLAQMNAPGGAFECERDKSPAKTRPFEGSLANAAVPAEWDFGFWKADCGSGAGLTGLSQAGTQAHALSCSRGTPFDGTYAATLAISAETSRATRIGDWDVGSYKHECGSNEYVSGLSLDTSTRALHGVRCARGAGSADHCMSMSVVLGDRGSTISGDWDAAQIKAECAWGQVVVGLSTSVADGAPHALLCCDR